MRLTIAKKLSFGLGLVCLMLGVIGVFTYTTGRATTRGVEDLTFLTNKNAVASDLVRNSLLMQIEAQSFTILNNDASAKKFEEATQSFATSLDNSDQTFTIPEHKAMAAEIRKGYDTYKAGATRLIEIIRERNGIVETRLNPAGVGAAAAATEAVASAKGADVASLSAAANIQREVMAARIDAMKYLASRTEEQRKKTMTSIEEAARLTAESARTEKHAATREHLQQTAAALTDYKAAFTRVGEINTERNQLVNEVITTLGIAIADKADQLSTSFEKTSISTASTVSSAVSTAKLTQLIIVGVASVIGVILAVTLTRSIVRPIRGVIRSAEVLATGNLTERLDDTRRDELGLLAKSFNAMSSSIASVIADVQKASGEVASAASEIAASAEQMAAGMQRQAEQTSEVSAAVSEMSASVQEVAQRSTDGRGVVEQTVSEMKTIAQQTQATSDAVNSLGKKSEEIGRIVSVINDIADQTNLLALNAAIEAARAGEHGRGFAVVADEVRKLAERTTDATQEIASSIRQIQAETTEAVTRMQTGTERVGAGVTLAQNAGEALAQIVAATTEQAGAAEQIAGNVERINAVTKESKDGAGQAAAAASQLSANAEQLQALIGRFKVA